jgi:pimeloyl-ACP methyl ester carboxylesterase
MHRRMSRYFGPAFRKSSPLLIDIMVKNMLKSHTVEAAQGRARAQYNATVGFDGTSLAGSIRCPTLVLTGSEDEIIPPQNSSEISKLIAHAKVRVFSDMGHLLLIEDPEKFVAEVRSFIEAPFG